MTLLFIMIMVLSGLTRRITSDSFQIAGLFPSGQTADVAFQNAVREASDNLKSKTDNELYGTLFNGETVNDSYIIRIDVCNKLKQGIIGVFGPSASESTSIVQSICDAKDIPRVQVHYENNMYRSSCLINLFPHPSALAKVYTEIIHKWEWKSFIIVYEDNESLLRISELLKPEVNGGAIVRLYQLTPPNHRRTLHKIRNSKETKILLDCSRPTLEVVLNQAQQVGIMTAEYSYIITCMDLHTLDLEQYKYSGVNITGLRLFDPFSSKINSTLVKWTINETEHFSFQQSLLEVETALIYDSVMLFAEAISYHSGTASFKQKSIDCDTNSVWNSGTTIINYMRTTELEDGMTGPIKFNSEGFRTDVELQITELTVHGLRYVGYWNTTKGITIEKTYSYVPEQLEIKDMRNMTFKVVIPMTNPYAMRKKSSVTLTGNDQYEGYCIDLINELSRMSGFKYTFIVQEDGNVGQLETLPNGTQQWNGMIGKVRRGEADLAIGDVTVTPERARDVDFTYQYMDLGMSILFTKPENKAPDLFSFLFPFSTDVWLLVITAYVGMSLLFFIMARLSPYEWTNPYPCIQEPEFLENQFTLSNSLWFTVGALMQQGSEIAPISTSTRIAAGFWWFFTLIMVSSYTANLAAFLTVENPISPFENVKELANQQEIKYGLKLGGSTFNYFRESTDETYKKMFNFMMAHKDEVFVTQYDIGVQKVVNEKGKYALLMESSSIEYEVEQHCELGQIGGLLDNKHFAIAVRKGSWYVGLLGRNILVLQEQGKLSDLKRRWWKEKYTKNCMEKKKNDAQTLELANVGGVFLVLIAGLILAFIVMLLELLWYSWNSSKTENTSVKRKLLQELKFIAKCKTVKPASPDDRSSILSSDNASENSNGNNNNRNNNNNGYTGKF